MVRLSQKSRKQDGGAAGGGRGGGLGLAAVAYISIDYLRHLSPSWHELLQPLLWIVLALIAITRVPFYKHWSAELRSALVFIAALVFMLCTLLYEMISVRSVTAVLGLTWHRYKSNFILFPLTLFTD